MESRVRQWAFADDGLERLSAVQRHPVRMGGAQAAVVRRFLRDIRDEIGGVAAGRTVAVRRR